MAMNLILHRYDYLLVYGRQWIFHINIPRKKKKSTLPSAFWCFILLFLKHNTLYGNYLWPLCLIRNIASYAKQEINTLIFLIYLYLYLQKNDFFCSIWKCSHLHFLKIICHRALYMYFCRRVCSSLAFTSWLFVYGFVLCLVVLSRQLLLCSTIYIQCKRLECGLANMVLFTYES